MKTEDLLQKYVSQGLSRDERFELEKRALEDDFLAAAWEGLQVYQGSGLRQKWNAIQSEWKSKTHLSTPIKPATKVVSMRPWMQYAAAAAVLLLGAALFFIRSDDTLSNESAVVALDPIEVAQDQQAITTSGSTQATAVIADLDEREAVEAENRIEQETEKIMSLTKIKSKISTADANSQKIQAPAPSQENIDLAYIRKTEPAIASEGIQNSIVSTSPTDIPNPGPSAEGRAAVPILKKVKDYGNVETPNDYEAPIIAKMKTEKQSSQKPERQFDPSLKERNVELIEMTDGTEGRKLTASDADLSTKLNSAEGLKRNILDNSKFSNPPDPAQASLEKARTLFLKDKNYEGARDKAQNAIALNPNMTEAYELIGDIYSASSYNCGDSWGQSLAALAAYDQYLKAQHLSDTPDIQIKTIALRDRFPIKDEGFMRGVKPGESVQVPCWIGEMVTVRYKN